jgi:beta-phosphoglucomutase-like phosphatase (HAD superfamily)
VIEAVLFDWNNTLVQFTWDDELLEEGHRVALGRDDPAFTARYRELMLGDAPQRPYAEVLRELGVEEPDAFMDAEHEVWRPAH